MSEEKKGGAAAAQFINGFDAHVEGQAGADEKRRESQIARVRAVLDAIMVEEASFCEADGVPPACIKFAALGTAVGAGVAAAGTIFKDHKPDNNPFELMQTVQSAVNIFVTRAQ